MESETLAATIEITEVLEILANYKAAVHIQSLFSSISISEHHDFETKIAKRTIIVLSIKVQCLK